MRLKVRLDAIFAHAHLIFYLMTSPCPSSSLWSVSLSVLWSGMTSLMNVLQNGPWWSGTKDWWLLSHCSGPGEQGQAYIMTQEEEKKKGELYRVNGFNAFASDLISLQRALKDIRHPEYVHTCVFCEDCVWCGCVYACMCVYILYIIHVFSVKTVCGVVVCMCVCVFNCVHGNICVVYIHACFVFSVASRRSIWRSYQQSASSFLSTTNISPHCFDPCTVFWIVLLHTSCMKSFWLMTTAPKVSIIMLGWRQLKQKNM